MTMRGGGVYLSRWELDCFVAVLRGVEQRDGGGEGQ